MITDYSFRYGNFNSQEVGLKLKSRPAEVKPTRKSDTVNIKTADGSLLRDYETFDSYALTLDCYIIEEYTLENIRRLKAMLSQVEGELVFAYNPDKVYQARLVEQVDFKELIDYSASVQITFEIQPFAKLESGKEVISHDTSFFQSFSLVNPTSYSALPIIKITPLEGQIPALYLNDTLIDFVNLHEEIILDSEIEECYNEAGENLNQYLSINSDFPILKPGENEFNVVNTAKVEIIPNWREI